ncbi:MAG: hypothetical protein JXQ73_14565 [Phycisphaerae bacterium]|nr:hypothetical protein [Phycisphaerae bacterium]
MSQPQRTSGADLLFLLLLIVSASIACSSRIGGGDTFVSLAAGRDVLAGKIGVPDDWSFTTQGRPWLNQNWGAHTAYYVSYWLVGDVGPVAIKWLVIFATMLLMVQAATERGGDRRFAAIVVAVTILIGKSYLDVRPQIFTLLFQAALIVVFFRWYKGSAAWSFVAMGVVALWANMHGGFIYGLALMGLWLGVQVFLKLVWPSSRPWGWRHPLLLAAALGGATFLAAVANPFGWVNITHPLVVEESPVWLSVGEWLPIVDWPATKLSGTVKLAGGFGSTWEFLVLMSVFALTIVVWGIFRLVGLGSTPQPTSREEKRRRPRDARRAGMESPAPPSPATRGWVACSGLFDLGLTIVVVTMAFKSRRFIPLATVAIVPIMLPMLEEILGRIKQAVLGQTNSVWGSVGRAIQYGLAVAGLAIGGYWAWVEIYIPYHDPNPYYPRQTVLMRMVGAQSFPDGAMDFLNPLIRQGKVPQHAFVDWRWEGYTRWRTDWLQPFCGGRAQQVYTEDVAQWQMSRPSEMCGPLQIIRTAGTLVIGNGQIVLGFDPKRPLVVEVAIPGRALARLLPAIAVKQPDGRPTRFAAEKVVSQRLVERTEIWADVDVVLERTSEPKYRAEYRVSIVGDPQVRPDDPRISGLRFGLGGFCQFRLMKITNTGTAPLEVVGHSVVMEPANASQVRPLAEGPIAGYQEEHARYGFIHPQLDIGLSPRWFGPENAKRLEAIGTIGGRTLQPGESDRPRQNTGIVFVHRVGPDSSLRTTGQLFSYVMVSRNARLLVEQADARAIDLDLFVLPRRSAGLAVLLLRSRRWACIYDDGTAFVLVNRRNPKSRQLIADILAADVAYPDEWLKAVGMALTRYSMTPPGADISQLRSDLKAALKLRSGPAAYWWLAQLPMLTPQASNPRELAQEIPFWLEQWSLVSGRPMPRQYAIENYMMLQMIAHSLRQSFARLKQMDKAEHWNGEFKRVEDTIERLREKYM